MIETIMNYDEQKEVKEMAKYYGYPTYEIIVKASNGDELAIRGILIFYDWYISKLCLGPFYHENDKVSMRIDEELKGKVQTELTKAMLKFESKVKQDCRYEKREI